MAEEDDLQQLLSDTTTPPILIHQTPSKFYSHFFFKSVFIATLVLVLSVFPSKAPPESVDQQTSILTRNWELVYVLIVGIAISYGLLSRKIDVDTEKEDNAHLIKPDNTSSSTYVSRILHVSSFFEDEAENLSDHSDPKIETWNSRYFRGDSEVVVAKESPVVSVSSTSSVKPLLLPVRSLRSMVSNSDDVVGYDFDEEVAGSSKSISRSSSGSKSVSFGKSRSGDLDFIELEEKLNENVVHRSPIPWRSRSGKYEMKEEVGGGSTQFYVPPPSVEESRFDYIESRSSLSSRPNSASPSPKKLSPSPSLLQEMQAKNVEESRRRKSFHSFSSPPPPPPPPPPLPTVVNRKPPLRSSNSIGTSKVYPSENKGTFKDEMMDIRMDSLRSETKVRAQSEGLPMGKSLRTIRAREPVVEAGKAQKTGVFEQPLNNAEKLRAVEVVKPQKMGGLEEPFNNGRRRSLESPKLTPKPQFEQSLNNSRRQSFESPKLVMPKPQISKYHKEKQEFVEKVIVDSEDDSDSEADESSGTSDDEEITPEVVNNASEADPNEVDKKADEFIAKFREQIRLQRINSIKRSSGKLGSRNISR
ncbi:hypothetical protein GIB67_008636 [Kingdonia uniflora]|uniref:Hydroxyproline-rich glycoprotein family protein n=1 Tax=Kingdonia uniflora TaxID=39325 RepID=A0A7J7M4X0_9MAGN|nr:hypothetical protein GIB67_008636 [Kingdonia uniflora]